MLTRKASLNQARLGRFRDMEPPTAEGMARRADAVNRLRTQAYVTAFASSPEHARRVNRAMTGTRTAADFVNMYASSPEIAARVNAR